MKNQSELFNLDKGVVYLNCATKSPALNSSKLAGFKAIESYSNPYQRTSEDFFSHSEILKKTFAKIIDCDDHERIAIIPSVSYGMANVVNNITFEEGDNIVIPDGQFPSNVYPWMDVAEEKNLEVRIIPAPDNFNNRAEQWNQDILSAIDEKTRVLAIGHVLWSDGTIFDLNKMRKKTSYNNALLILDATQSIGALPFSIKEIKPDALICAGYKWLLGPYSLGLAYYSEAFDGGKPIEQNWMTRKDSDNFAKLVNYQDEFRPKAYRYSMGESSQFILRPMLQSSLEQILKWGVHNIQDYVKKISASSILELRDMGIGIEDDKFRSHHLFGLRLPDNLDRTKFQKGLFNRKIFLSIRGDAVRVAPHVYNSEEDLKELVDVIKHAL